MDERLWLKARSLADAFSSAYDEDVALVLGEGLLEALADLLPLEDARGKAVKPEWFSAAMKEAIENYPLDQVVFAEAANSNEQFAKMQAKAQHPAFKPANVGQVTPFREPCDFCGSTDHRSRCGYCDGHHPDEPIHEEQAGYLPHPKFLNGGAAYAAAPKGTVTGDLDGYDGVEK